MKAMILAAGLGTRLLPYTLKRPKPLFPILNRPLLHLTISRLQQAGFTEIIVNAHHLRGQIKKNLQKTPNIILQEEKKILGTGGGLRMALEHFGHNPLLVVNGDIYHTIDYRQIYQAHLAGKPDATLVLHDNPRFNDVAVDKEGRVAGFTKDGAQGSKDLQILAFTGIHVINPGILKAIPNDTASCIIDCYRKLLQQGGTIRAYRAIGHFWTDMGTPADYLELHAGLLTRKVPVYEELAEAAAGGPFIGAESAHIAQEVRLLDWACIGKDVSIGAGATLQRSVVWDGAVVPAGSVFRDAIITP